MGVMTELQAIIQGAIDEDWNLVKDTAGTVNTAAEIFPLAYRFGWHAARKHAGYVAAAERIRQLEEANEKLTAEAGRMRPVVEAAQRQRHGHERRRASENYTKYLEIAEAVDAYESSKPE